MLVKDQGSVTSTSSFHKLAHAKVSVVGWRVGDRDGATVKVGNVVGANDTVGAIVTVGSGDGTEVGIGEGIQVPIVHVSLVGDTVGIRVSFPELGATVGKGVGPTSELQLP